jgi:hypothetical protein
MTPLLNLVYLNDGRPGIRALMQVEVRAPGLNVGSTDGSEGTDGKNPPPPAGYGGTKRLIA